MRTIVRRSASFTALALAAGLVMSAAPSPAGAGLPAPVVGFDALTQYTVSGAVAEIVAASPDGETLVYTDSETVEIGFVDISDPSTPTEIGTLGLGGSPTSVAATPAGDFAPRARPGTHRPGGGGSRPRAAARSARRRGREQERPLRRHRDRERA